MTRLITAACAVAATALVAGCGSDITRTESTTPTESPTSASSSPSQPAPSSSPASPSVAPGTGPLVHGTIYTLRLPQGWKEIPGELGNQRTLADTEGPSSGSIFEDDGAAPGGATPAALNRLARSALQSVRSEDGKARRLPDVRIAGVTFCHVEGHRKYSDDDEYDTVVGDIELRIVLHWASYLKPPLTAYQRKARAQLLAGLMLK